MMHSASRQASDKLREQAQALLGDSTSAGDLSSVAGELYAVADLLVGQPRLRRTLGDPATSPDARTELAARLLSGKISDPALALVKAAVGQRWSTPWDLGDALEGAGDDALFAAAESEGSLGNVEDELFRFERILEGEGELTGLLDEIAVDADRRAALVDSVLAGKASEITATLVRHAVRSERKRSILLALGNLVERAAAREHRSIASVVSAVPLTTEQQQRLTAVLTQMYARPISVRTSIDPSVRGGLVVRVGDEVIDGSIASRIAQARTALAG